MKIKIFYLIFLLKFFFYSCFPVIYYQGLISKYSYEAIVYPESYQGVGFILDISGFKEKEEIYFKISLHEDDARDGDSTLKYYINFESTFDITEETSLDDFQSIERKETSVSESSKSYFYFEITKNNPNLNFLKFVIVSNSNFKSHIGFKNTKDDESPFVGGFNILIVVIIFVVFVITLSVVCFIIAIKKKKRDDIIRQQIYAHQQINNQQLYDEHIYAQHMNEQQIYVQQQIYGQQQMNDQPQMNGQQGVNLENNMNVQNNQPNSNTINPNETTPINKKGN